MCGFVTIVNAPGQAVSGRVVRGMVAALSPRGPDDVGYACVDPLSGSCRTWDDVPDDEELPGIVFGHRRLSILDLSPAAHQPMLGDDGSHVLAYNGEIYNFVELRRQLESGGARFRGHGDTEVLLRAYQHWGASCVRRFNGMWAFTLWDGRSRSLLASRDRFGVKPLYYAVVAGAWVFVSEIKALAAYPGGLRGPDEQKVAEFLTQCALDHGPDTMFRGVRALPPATVMRVSPGAAEGGARPQAYWCMALDDRHRGQSDARLVEELSALLDDAVRLRLRSDVPTGTMLSGGLDSTSITLSIEEQRQGGVAGCDTRSALVGDAAPHQAFTACFPGWGSDEAAGARLLCEQTGVRSHLVCPTGPATLDALPEVVYRLDEPFISPTAVVNYLLMRQARACGVKVVVNGHGSDEMLGGYPGKFVAPLLAGLLLTGRPAECLRQCRLFGAYGSAAWRPVLREVMRAVVPERMKVAVRCLRGLTPADRRRRKDWVFEPPPNPPGPWLANTAPIHSPVPLSPLNAALWSQFTSTVLPRWLRMEDRMSMAWSVESRLPFMDYRLAEFVFNLPDRFKLKDGHTKYILRKAMWDRLPEQIVRTRAKRCFGTPYPEWLRGAWRPMVQDLLLCGTCHVQPYLRLPQFRAQLREYLDGREGTFSAGTLWRVLNTELWLRCFATAGRAA